MQQAQSRVTIIFAAFLSSSLVYLIVGFALQKTGWKPVLEDPALIRILLGVFFVVSIGLIFALTKIKNLPLKEPTDQNVFSRSILLFAIAEIPSILGLLLFFLSGSFLYLVFFCGLSIVAFLMVRK